MARVAGSARIARGNPCTPAPVVAVRGPFEAGQSWPAWPEAPGRPAEAHARSRPGVVVCHAREA